MSDRAQASLACDHHWESKHQPGLPIYWIDQCSLCGDFEPAAMRDAIQAAGYAKEGECATRMQRARDFTALQVMDHHPLADMSAPCGNWCRLLNILDGTDQ